MLLAVLLVVVGMPLNGGMRARQALITAVLPVELKCE